MTSKLDLVNETVRALAAGDRYIRKMARDEIRTLCVTIGRNAKT